MNVDEEPDPAPPTAETMEALAEVLLRVVYLALKPSRHTCQSGPRRIRG